MKKLYATLTLIIAMNVFVKAQTTLSTATNFTVTDLKGNTYKLFDLLATGKYVCLDFFFTTCVPCQGLSPKFKTAYQNYGCNTKDIFFMSVDNGDTKAQVEAYENSYLGGNAGFPAISGTEGGGTAVNTAYGIGAWPTIILIAPNKQIVEKDIWPINSAADFDKFFSKYPVAKGACTTVGVEQSAEKVNFLFYPNPAKNSLTISVKETNLISYSIYDVVGKKYISDLSKNDKVEEINIESLNTGMYFIEVETNSGKSIKTFVKE